MCNSKADDKNIKLKGIHVKNIRKFLKNEERYIEKGICPKCHCELEIKKGNIEYFYKCSSRNKCDFTTPLKRWINNG
ncbi:DNA topoisomerase I [Bacillus cereus]|nr:DNA topoisomerase I [Bacillus cereus]